MTRGGLTGGPSRQRETHVASDITVREEEGVLEDETDATQMRRYARDIAPIPPDRPCLRCLHSSDAPQDGTLATSAGSEYGDDLPGRDGKVQSGDDGASVVGDHKPGDAQPLLHGSPPPAASWAQTFRRAHDEHRHEKQHDGQRGGHSGIGLAGAAE